MSTATVTSKGQVTIPKDVRDRLNIGPGSRIEFIVEASGRTAILAKKLSIDDLVGILPKPARAATNEEIREAIRKGWAGER